MRCADDSRIDETVVTHDKTGMFYFGLRVAEMKLTIRVER